MTIAPLNAEPSAWAASGSRSGRRSVALLDLDPDLGALLPRERWQEARTALVVHELSIGRGPWAGGELAGMSARHVGLLLVRGAMTREVVLQDTVSSELIAPGDVLRPWTGAGGAELLEARVRWQVLADARFAILDHAFALALGRYPEVNLMLIDRLSARTSRAATMKAIAQLNSVERRLVALFWHLAESWGHVGRDGVIVPLELSHRLLGELIGARRPTVSTALAALRRDGRVRRRADGGWLLAGDPPAPPDVAHERVTLHRRRLVRDPTRPALTATV
jgi:CRP/FNR family transcriptional regulator, cyclic AMP receptor protein